MTTDIKLDSLLGQKGGIYISDTNVYNSEPYMCFLPLTTCVLGVITSNITNLSNITLDAGIIIFFNATSFKLNSGTGILYKY